METFLSSVAGVDFHKNQITISVIIGEHGEDLHKETWESKTFTEDLEICGRKLLAMGIKHVAMESSGIYWRPIFNVWNNMGIIFIFFKISLCHSVSGPNYQNRCYTIPKTVEFSAVGDGKITASGRS